VTALAPALDQLTLDITEEILVRAPIAIAFDALLDEIGPAAHGHNDTPMPMKLEAWPGGRWYRDLGDDNGHFWGQVQAIKRPSLLELTGPMMMSFAVASNVQYRLKEVDTGTLITLHHTALGLFPDGYRTPLTQGWTRIFERVRQRAERTSR
jgi:uncharacterized protein YndB with AHSA1/START domain